VHRVDPLIPHNGRWHECISFCRDRKLPDHSAASAWFEPGDNAFYVRRRIAAYLLLQTACKNVGKINGQRRMRIVKLRG
jgi:hypothetical protein